MGTNYYLKLEENKCKHCGHSKDSELLHIGKSSAGWCFSLHIIPERNINNLSDWLALCKNGIIEDEYGEVLSLDSLESIITKRSWSGPNGLLRHTLDQHCVKHGEGTWDYIIGEFS